MRVSKKSFVLLLLLGVFLGLNYLPVPARAQSALQQSKLPWKPCYAWKLLKENYMFPEKLKPLESFAWRWQNKPCGQKEQDSITTSIIESLDDEYTFMSDSAETAERNIALMRKGVVNVQLLPGQIALISIDDFMSKSIIQELRQALQNLEPTKACIIDLRNNPGGNIDSAIEATTFFVASGKLVSFWGRADGQDYQEEVTLTKNNVLSTKNGITSKQKRQPQLINSPIIILVNEKTKSSAELFAGILKDRAGAKLVGAKTYGKGLMQTVWYLTDDTSIRIATAFYILPVSGYIHKRGLKPDIMVPQPIAKRSRTTIEETALLLCHE